MPQELSWPPSSSHCPAKYYYGLPGVLRSGSLITGTGVAPDPAVALATAWALSDTELPGVPHVYRVALGVRWAPVVLGDLLIDSNIALRAQTATEHSA